MRTHRSVPLLLLVGFLSTGCASWSKTEQGAATGAAAGAVLGGVIGSAAGSTTKGAILGAVLGGAAGAAIGQRMDKQAEELEAELDNATVERVGEGIQVTFDSGILFDFDSDALRPEARANLADLAASLGDYEGTRVLVVGHTDDVGSEDYNQELSERRSNAARAHLLMIGVSPERVEAMGLGESEPVSPNDTDMGQQENRRVEVAIFASEDLREEMTRRHGG